jgi:D-sedoheptulose 7-phosphate isomerase
MDTNISKIIFNQLADLNSVLQNLNKNHFLIIGKIAEAFINAIKNKKKIYLIGNGGSAAECQHFAAELVVKFKKIRKPIPAMALTTDTSILTACSNDFDYKFIFKRQLEAFAKKDDLLLAFTTSGKSQNIIEAIKFSKKIGVKTILMTSELLKKKIKADIIFKTPSLIVSRIQEIHLFIIHIMCEILDNKIK